MSEQTVHTRRAFLRTGLALVSASATVPVFLNRTAWAINGPGGSAHSRNRPGANDDRILVILQLAGGNDGLNTIVPFENDLYYKARPRLGIAKDKVLKLTDELGFHPEAAGLKQLYDDGLLAVIQGVGYPNPNRSHFVSTDIWSLADPKERTHVGWLGRYFDSTCAGSRRPDPKLGIALTREAPLAMMGERFSPVSFENPKELTWRGPGASGQGVIAFQKLNQPGKYAAKQQDASLDAKSALTYLERTAMDARMSASEIQSATGVGGGANGGRGRRRGGGKRSANGELGQKLTMVSRMIAAGLETKVYYVSIGGFDTHAGQGGRHQKLIRQLSGAVAEFTRDLKENGLLDRVTLMTFSEFGRRVAENGSQGTDHGTAAPLFVVGSQIKPGIHGEHPSLEPHDLDRGDLKWQVDFRSIYAAVLADWLKVDATRILGGDFGKASLFKD